MTERKPPESDENETGTLTPFTGEIIAFATVLCWTVGSQFFEAAGKRVGSLTINLVRLVLAAVFLCLTLFITKGQLIPTDFPLHNWAWLAVSGVIGFALGDLFLFKAFVEIGPRISMLVMSLSAPVTALIGWGFLGEIYRPTQWLGIVVTLIGVALVILERNGAGSTELATPRKRILKKITPHGVLMAFLGMLGQAIGYIFSKVGMQSGGHMLDPVAATYIRVIAGTLGVIVIFFALGWWSRMWLSRHDLRALALTSVGAFLGPYLGVVLSLAALHYTSAGVASTIMALTPVTLIPFAVFIHKEHVSLRALVGTLVAFSGIVLLIS
jgi:drug/metabolite transporter (DMT)-like permease